MTQLVESMEFARPTSLADALAVKAEHPDAVPIAGGTDVMVELNFDHRRPRVLLDLTAVPELAAWDRDGDTVRIGATVPYATVIRELRADLPGLAMAARTVGSPQIRNRGTVGGNLGSASPAGDAHPPLLATVHGPGATAGSGGTGGSGNSGGAVVEVASAARGMRTVPIGEFFVGVKRSALAPDELITAVRVPRAAGPQQFAKVGTRNAMVIAVCSFAVSLRPGDRAVGTGIGSAAPTPVRATAAAEFAAAALDWDGRAPLADDVSRRFGELVADAASPIDDVRGTAAYRRHALSVLARRTLGWAWREHRES